MGTVLLSHFEMRQQNRPHVLFLYRLLNAELVEINVNGFGYAGEIGGEKINVRLMKHYSPAEWLQELLQYVSVFLVGRAVKFNKLKTNSIEGTYIYLEHTYAKVVRGEDIKIGPGCRIKRVEYSGSLEVDAGAVVEKKIKF